VHVADWEDAEALAVFDETARRLADAFWPGSLTLVLPRRENTGLSELVSAGLPTIALRMPSHADARAMIRAAGVPIAAPSANLSGKVSPTTAAHVAADIGGKVDLILDGGPCEAGLESTIVALSDGDAVLLRAGAVARDAIESVLGDALIAAREADSKPQAPGMLASHYAPRAGLRLDAIVPQTGEAYLGFGPSLSHTGPSLNLSETGNLREAAANLFACLRLLDAEPITMIAVAPVPETGLGEAINDRLRRAAAPR
jgi:L-threonylcarbamoyladenylate synthase